MSRRVGMRARLPALWDGLRPALLDDLRSARSRSLGVRSWHALQRAHLDLVPFDLPGDCAFLDLGANVGDWARDVLIAFPDSRVIAAEPGPGPLRTLKERFGSDSRVEIVPQPVASEVRRRDFHLTAHDHNASLQRPLDMDAHYGHGWQLSETVELETTTVDRIAAGVGSAVIKLDVQGAELEVLRGASETLERTHAVVLEVTFVDHYENGATFAQLHEHMTAEGFALTGLTEPHRSRDGRALWSDAVYCRFPPGRSTPVRDPA